MAEFSIVIPVKGGPSAKSRFGGSADERAALALAMALDTVSAAVAVANVIVVVPDSYAAPFAELGARTVTDPGGGLIAAISHGLLSVPSGNGSAVLLGDLPGLQPAELAAALALATERVLVADADGTGTVLVAAPPGASHNLGFGEGSRARHLDFGYRELLEPWPGLRRDVDRPEHLEGLVLGGRTALIVER